ncbi:putative death-on-curing protein [Tolypothrix sp. PCC 7601]|nr:putative death-on-curing protein [Tolypothrix sp. PCC 7601]BAY91538.1 hypothetical protein NIES3275_35620 [Microchaete diplosiphon NIES-3275]
MRSTHDLGQVIEEPYEVKVSSTVLKTSRIGDSLAEFNNKRIGHAAMEVFLILNGFEINATVDEQEQVILQVAAGQLGRNEFTEWLRSHIVSIADFRDFP